MSKKRNRQPDAKAENNEASTESCDDSVAANKCPHVVKAVNITKIKKNIKKAGIPLECPTCKKNEHNSLINGQGDAPTSTLWICLQCGNLGCGRGENEHAIEHYKVPHSDCHFIVAETRQWSVWCYQCETEVSAGHSRKLQDVIEFVKKCSSTTCYSQPKMPMIQCQKEVSVETDQDKQKVPSNLPKVGGLANLGNTCFFNAVLQCLAQTPFLVKVLEDLRLPGQAFVLPGGKYKASEDSEEIDLPPIEGTLEKWGSFTSILCKTLTEMQGTNGHQVYTPSELLSNFKKKTIQCMDGGQHDSHELLRHLLEIVRNEDLRRYQSIILKEVGLNEKTNPEAVEHSLKSRVKFYGNQASARLLGPELVFRGVLVSTLECLDCHHSSQSMEPFLDLSLPVMADKPQPPVLKRKNSGLDDTFDLMGNSISHTPSKHQLKKEKKAMKKRMNRRQENYDLLNPGITQNNIVEEQNGSVVESEESDADVEDNVETEGQLPEIGESGYSSAKPSALTSPVSPSNHWTPKAPESLSSLPLDNFHPPQNPLEYLGPIPLRDSANANSASPTDTSTADLTQTKPSDGVESPENVETEIVGDTEFTLPTSLAANSDLTSPEGPTASLSSATSKESPSSPILGALNGDESEKQDRLPSWLNLVDSSSIKDKPEFNHATETKMSEDLGESNMINGVTAGISRLGIAGNLHQSPTRYPTKEGECSIQSCLNQFTALELMSGSNKVGCEECTARERKIKQNHKMVCTPSTKQYLISRVPAVLILHLKRFQAQRVDFRKVTKPVSFPVLLDLSPVCKGHRKSRIYSLYGVVEHKGTIHGGHYVAYVKSRMPLTANDPRWFFLPSREATQDGASSSSSSSDSEAEEAAANPLSTIEPPVGKWYYVSDSRVMEVDEKTVLQSQAYLLFYERIF